MLVVKNPPANAGDIRDMGLIPGLGWSPGEGNGNPHQDSCLEGESHREAWGTTVQCRKESDTIEASYKWKKPILKDYTQYASNNMTFRKRWNYGESKKISGCQGLEGREGRMLKAQMIF